MSKALSVDLRERVLAAVANGATHREAADRFGVSAAQCQPVASSAKNTMAICGQVHLVEIDNPTGLKLMPVQYWTGWPRTAMQPLLICGKPLP